MYSIKLLYDPEPRTQTLKESVTYCASIDLYVLHGIDSYQTSASTLSFNSERDRTFALMVLSSSTSFRPTVIN